MRTSGGSRDDRAGGEPGRRLPVREVGPIDLPASPVGALPSVAELGRVPAGPALAAVVATLSGDEAVFEAWAATAAVGAGDPRHPRLLDLVRADARVTLMQAAARVAAWAAGLESALTWRAYQDVSGDTKDTSGDGHVAAVGELALALRRPHGSVTCAVQDGYQLSRHAGLSWLLTEGHLSWAHARAVLAETLNLVDDDLVHDVEAMILRRAPEQTPGELRAATRRAVLRVDPRTAGERHAAALADRGVWIRPLPDGMAEVGARVTATEAANLGAALDRLVRGLNTQNRNARNAEAEASRNGGRQAAGNAAANGDADVVPVVRATRADALAAIAAALLADGTTAEENLPATVAGILTAAGTAAVAVRVQITAAALAGLSAEPAELDGYGPIPAWLGRLLTSGGSDWQIAVTDGAGALLDIHPLVYQPTAKQRAYVTARALTCGSPNCSRQADRCDVDHVIPFNHDDPESGGWTEVHNLCPLCRVHHNLKTHGNFQTRYADDGTLITITPLGRVYFTPAAVQPCAP